MTEIVEMRKRPRTEIAITEERGQSMHRFTVTRKGVEIESWYGLATPRPPMITLTWEQLEMLKERVYRQYGRGSFDPKECYLEFNRDGVKITGARE